MTEAFDAALCHTSRRADARRHCFCKMVESAVPSFKIEKISREDRCAAAS
jgi:hypothetical protein